MNHGVNSARMAAAAIAGEDWPARLARSESVGDFLSDFGTVAVEALGMAARDMGATAAERAAAAYRLADIVKRAADQLEQSFPIASGHLAAPDCGFIRAVSGAVEAMHRAANERPKAFHWKEHYQAWPVLLAPDGSIFARCFLPEQLPGRPLFSASGIGGGRDAGPGRRVNRGGIWAALAEEFFHKGNVGRVARVPGGGRGSQSRCAAFAGRHVGTVVKLTPRRDTPWVRWAPWKLVRRELESSKAEVMQRPEVSRWAASGSNAAAKQGVLWSRILRETQRALESLARR